MTIKSPSLEQIFAALMWCIAHNEPKQNRGKYSTALHLRKATYSLGAGAINGNKLLSRSVDKYEFVGWSSLIGFFNEWDGSLRKDIFHYSTGHGWRLRKEPRRFAHIPRWQTAFQSRFGADYIKDRDKAYIYLLDDRWYEFPFLEYHILPCECLRPCRIHLERHRAHLTVRVDYKSDGCNDIPF